MLAFLRMTGPGSIVESMSTTRAKNRVSSWQCEIAGRYGHQRAHSSDEKAVSPKEVPLSQPDEIVFVLVRNRIRQRHRAQTCQRKISVGTCR